MIKFTRNILANGLRVLIHRDDTTPMAAVNLLYDVGSRDEQPEKTGFAHLFEHLMFCGSVNVPFYDRDPGLFIVRGRVTGGITMENAHDRLLAELDDFASAQPEKQELEKVQNKLEATRQYTHTDIMHKASDLAYYELLGDAGELNSEIKKYRSTDRVEIEKTAKSLFDPLNSSTLFYYSKKQSPKH